MVRENKSWCYEINGAEFLIKYKFKFLGSNNLRFLLTMSQFTLQYVYSNQSHCKCGAGGSLAPGANFTALTDAGRRLLLSLLVF